MKRVYFISALFLVFLSCKERSPISQQFLSLGTVVNISIYDEGNVDNLQRILDSVITEIKFLDELWAYKSDNSDIFRLNNSAGSGFQAINPLTTELLQKGLAIEQATEGAFTIKIEPLTDLWGFRSDNPHIPDSADILKTLPLTNIDFILKGDSCELKIAGSGLDVGGIAKGFAVDLAVEKLQSLGVKSGIVSAGGDVKAFGSPGKNTKWRIGIRHPRKPDDFYTIIEIEKGAVSTSGDYQQYFEVDGVRYHHIIDPETGYPPHRCVSATVIAESGAEADALATALFIMGPEKGAEWLKNRPQYEGMIVYFDDKGNLVDYRTPGIE